MNYWILMFRRLVLVFSCVGVFLGAAWAADNEIARVGNEIIYDSDMLFMISSSAGDQGDGMRTGLALIQMDKRARLEMARKMADELLYAEAARAAQLHESPEVSRMLRWQEIRTLAGLYLAEISATWDLSDAAAKKYYDAHPEEFIQAEAVKMKYLALPASFDVAQIVITSPDLATIEAVAEKYFISADLSSIGHSDWMERGLVRAEFEAPFFSGDRVGVLDPIKSEGVYYLVEITERRPPRQMPWEEVSTEARQRLERHLLTAEAEKLKSRYPVRIDEKALTELGKR
ncbi:MAG: peptidyl-prolyl cis-trans isomerase [Synergistaceae bacterium]|nr:peptidyl-prolyl cis-trans isomerase [Synergistaceae bacterium]